MSEYVLSKYRCIKCKKEFVVDSRRSFYDMYYHECKKMRKS